MSIEQTARYAGMSAFFGGGYYAYNRGYYDRDPKWWPIGTTCLIMTYAVTKISMPTRRQICDATIGFMMTGLSGRIGSYLHESGNTELGDLIAAAGSLVGAIYIFNKTNII